MEEPRNNGEEMEKEVENVSKGKLERGEGNSVVNILEETGGKIYTMKANEEQKDEMKIESRKISRKNNLRTNVTVPRPFNLATEKRMTRERKGSLDFENPKQGLSTSARLKPSLSRSASFNPKTSSDLKGRPNTSLNMTSLKPKVRTNEKDEKNLEVKHTENHSKKHGGHRSKNTPKESCVFKALPLPSFYKQKDFPTTSETKKMMVVQHSRASVVGSQVKTLQKSDSHKFESNMVSMGTGSGAKETIREVIRNKNSLKTNPKVTAKDLILSDA